MQEILPMQWFAWFLTMPYELQVEILGAVNDIRVKGYDIPTACTVVYNVSMGIIPAADAKNYLQSQAVLPSNGKVH
jgi:hypothetical protein